MLLKIIVRNMLITLNALSVYVCVYVCVCIYIYIKFLFCNFYCILSLDKKIPFVVVITLFLKKKFFFGGGSCCMACGILVPWPGMELAPCEGGTES